MKQSIYYREIQDIFVYILVEEKKETKTKIDKGLEHRKRERESGFFGRAWSASGDWLRHANFGLSPTVAFNIRIVPGKQRVASDSLVWANNTASDSIQQQQQQNRRRRFLYKVVDVVVFVTRTQNHDVSKAPQQKKRFYYIYSMAKGVENKGKEKCLAAYITTLCNDKKKKRQPQDRFVAIRLIVRPISVLEWTQKPFFTNKTD